jgi:hypothetical protein
MFGCFSAAGCTSATADDTEALQLQHVEGLTSLQAAGGIVFK